MFAYKNYRNLYGYLRRCLDNVGNLGGRGSGQQPVLFGLLADAPLQDTPSQLRGLPIIRLGDPLNQGLELAGNRDRNGFVQICLLLTTHAYRLSSNFVQSITKCPRR